MFFGIFTPKIWGKIPTHFDLTPIFRMGGWWKTTPRQSHTPGAHPRQSPYPTMKGFPLQPVGTGCSGCVPVRCVETTLERFPWDNPSLRIIYIYIYPRWNPITIGIRSLPSMLFDEVQATEAAEGQESLEAPVECLSDVVYLPWYFPYLIRWNRGKWYIYHIWCMKNHGLHGIPYKPNSMYGIFTMVKSQCETNIPKLMGSLEKMTSFECVRFLGCNPFPYSPWDWYICLHVT